MNDNLLYSGALHITGTDAKRFLQGQLTCDLNTVTETPTLGAHCQRDGRVISLFYIHQSADGYVLSMPSDMIAITLAALKKYAVFFKVALQDTHSDINPSVAESQHYQQLRAGIPRLYPTTSSLFLPHELNLPALQAVNFDKGCYTGQEVIARMHYRGKLKNHLYCVTINSDIGLAPGADIYCITPSTRDVVGKLVDCCQDSALVVCSDPTIKEDVTLVANSDGTIEYHRR